MMNLMVQEVSYKLTKEQDEFVSVEVARNQLIKELIDLEIPEIVKVKNTKDKDV